ncbi:MAG: DUF1698 domain-containing protein [Planctomycetota bacterium]
MSITASDIRSLGEWFYDFTLPGGVRTNPELSDDLRTIHRDRALMLDAAAVIAFPHADPEAPLRGKRVLDVGCHEGFFLHRMMHLGASSAVGVDVREQNIAKARVAASSLPADRVSWHVANAEDLDAALTHGTTSFDVSLAFGLLYHCENPIRVLRQTASVTEHAIILESQLCDESHAEAVEWGRAGYTLPPQGVFTVIDESRLHPSNNETGISPLALCPSQHALRTALAHCGFGAFHRVTPHDGANEQLTRGKRGVFVATRTEPARGVKH